MTNRGTLNLVDIEQKTVVGRVKWFNNQKGFGFIIHESDPDIFVHHTAIRMDGYRTLKQGEEVRFDLVETDKGLQAINVMRTVEEGADAPEESAEAKQPASEA
jgi:CspA family cold shock protein